MRDFKRRVFNSLKRRKKVWGVETKMKWKYEEEG